MKIFRIHNIEEYRRHQEKNANYFHKMMKYEREADQPNKQKFTVKGVSVPGNSMVEFFVDRLYSNGNQVNWRERLVCPITGLNNRLRASYHLLESELGIYDDDRIFITEQVTHFYKFLTSKYSRVSGSEYLNPKLKSGTIVKGVRHEDMTSLSFEDESYDICLSFECLEHIPDYSAAIKEIARILRPGGRFLGTFPFASGQHENIIRATMTDTGHIIHYMEPEYHGNPVDEKGSLCFTVFGWEVLDIFKAAGFKDAYALLYWSDVFGYLGGEQIVFVAQK
mgnify:CR=1 FL=1